MAEAYIGQITLFGGNFAPRGWALCQGQILSIAQNTALFSILGTTYGGNGQTTFALPDLRGRVPIQQGQGPGLSPYSLGQQGGTETVTLNTNQMPQHTHPFAQPASSSDGDSPSPNNNLPAVGIVNISGTDNTANDYRATDAPDVTLRPGTTGPAGGNQPTPNIQPYLCLNFIICLQGIFPPRN